MDIEERLNFIEFRQQLLFQNDALSRLLFEYKISEKQYNAIMDVMDLYSDLIVKGEPISNGSFENSIYEKIPEKQGNYHFCEYIAKAFYDEKRWPEVFTTLYGKLPKYNYIFDK